MNRVSISEGIGASLPVYTAYGRRQSASFARAKAGDVWRRREQVQVHQEVAPSPRESAGGQTRCSDCPEVRLVSSVANMTKANIISPIEITMQAYST